MNRYKRVDKEGYSLVAMNATSDASWYSLSADLYVRILIRLPLHVLCGLKAVSRATANTCRRVLRSEEWQDMDQNEFDLRAALGGSPQQIQFPFTVSVLADYFGGPGPDYQFNGHEGDKYLLATVHRLKIMSFDNDAERVPFHEALRMNADDIRQVLVDVCIEIHGYGIVSSEQQLRSVLETIVQRRGARRFPMQKSAALAASNGRISGLELKHLPNGDWIITGDNFDNNVMLTRFLLDNMLVVTKVAKDKWMHHDGCIQTYNHTVLDLMRMEWGPFA